GMIRQSHRTDTAIGHFSADNTAMQGKFDIVLQGEAIESELGRFGIQHDDPVTAFGNDRLDVDPKVLQLQKKILAHAENHLLRGGSASVKAAVGQHLGVSRGPTHEAITFNQEYARTGTRGANSSSNSA